MEIVAQRRHEPRTIDVLGDSLTLASEPRRATRRGALVACHDCDALQRIPESASDGAICCHRCGARLRQIGAYSLDRPLALVLTALVLFVLANAYPMVVIEIEGTRIATTLLHAVHQMWLEHVQLVSALVFVTVILMPATQILAMLYVLLPLRVGRVPPGVELPLRLFQFARPWGMVEVFILGILVSLVKLANMAHVVPGVALWAFAILVIVFAALGSAFDPIRLWTHIERAT